MEAFLYPLYKPKAIVSSLNCAMSVGVLTLNDEIIETFSTGWFVFGDKRTNTIVREGAKRVYVDIR
jgi:hypothetical protein